jgi:hypothetical protein
VKVIRDVTAFDITVVYLVVVDVMVDVTIVVAVCWKNSTNVMMIFG